MILVTGGAGSIGSEVVRRLAHDGESVRVLDINEESLWSLKAEFPQVQIVLGDVQSPDDVRSACEGARVVVHCAALKHVDLCEQSPAVAHRVNVQGTRNVSVAAEKTGARMVLVSTDKAIQPQSVMGQTKAAAECAVLVASQNVVRFGNVIGTRGSLLPMVLRCKALGRSIPLTDARMTRWFMTAQQAVSLIYEAMKDTDGGKVFSPKNPRCCNVATFVWACRNQLAPELEVQIVGMRPGERVHEPMLTRAGEIVWSNDERYEMGITEIHDLIGASVAARREAA